MNQQKYISIILNKNSPEKLKHLVNDEDPIIKKYLAETTTSSEILDDMSHDRLFSVLTSVVNNEHTSNETLLRLALSDTTSYILYLILNRSNVPNNVYIAARANLFFRFFFHEKNKSCKGTKIGKKSKCGSKNSKKVSNRVPSAFLFRCLALCAQ